MTAALAYPAPPTDFLAFELPATDRIDITRAATIDSLTGYTALTQYAAHRDAGMRGAL